MSDLINTFVSNYAGSLITLLTSVLFGRYILKKEYKLNKLLMLALVIGLSIVLNSFYLIEIPYLRTVVAFASYLMIFRIVFGEIGSQLWVMTIIFFIMLFAGEILLFIILTSLFKISGNQAYMNFGGSLEISFFVGLLCMIISYFLRKLIVRLINTKIKNKIIVYWGLSGGCLILFLMTIFSNDSFNIETYLVLGMITVMLVIIVVSFYQTYKNDELTIKYDKLLDFIKKYEIEIDNQRTMRHEIKNQLLTIKSKLIDEDKNENVITYIDEILEDNNKEINHTIYAKLNKLPPNGLKGLFYFKVNEAIDKKIDVDINISNKIADGILKDLNSSLFNQLGKLIGIVLDNAIEASEISNDKKIGIEIYNNDESVEFIISNTYIKVGNVSRKPLSRSTKGEGRGHGLILAKAIIKSNSRLDLQTTITEELYIQKLILKK